MGLGDSIHGWGRYLSAHQTLNLASPHPLCSITGSEHSRRSGAPQLGVSCNDCGMTNEPPNVSGHLTVSARADDTLSMDPRSGQPSDSARADDSIASPRFGSDSIVATSLRPRRGVFPVIATCRPTGDGYLTTAVRVGEV